MNKVPMYSAYSQLEDDFGLTLPEDLFETYALAAYRKIGNKDYRLYHMVADTQKDCDCSWFIEKPCNMDEIEAITLNYEHASEHSATENYPGYRNHSIEQWIEGNKYMNNSLYLPGQLVKYTELGDRIYFTEPYRNLHILYKGQYLDEQGLPYINEKEQDAIVAYCVYAYDLKQARLTKDPNTFQLAQSEYALWQKACSSARAPMYLSQNAMNEILDVMTSWGRHSYGCTSTKPIN